MSAMNIVGSCFFITMGIFCVSKPENVTKLIEKVYSSFYSRTAKKATGIELNFNVRPFLIIFLGLILILLGIASLIVNIMSN